MRVSEELQIARTEIAKGWAQKTLCDEDGNVCAMGALLLAGGGQRGQSLAAATVNLMAYRILAQSAPLGGVLLFNNHPDTTHADVLAWFDAAIAIAEARECKSERQPAVATGTDDGRGTTAIESPVLATRA